MARMMRSLPLLLVVGLGCGGSSSSDSPTPDAAAPPEDVGAGDVAVPGDVATEDAKPKSDVPGPPLKPGNLRVSYVSADSYHVGDVQNAVVIAGFYDEVPNPSSSTSYVDGPCTVETVTFGEPNFKLEYHHAGKLTLAGGAVPVTLANGPAGYVAFQDQEHALWQGGETLTFAATGGDIAGFDVQVTAPSHVTVTAPVLPMGSALPVPKTKDLAFAWTGATAGEVVVRLAGPQVLPSPQTYVTCRFPSAAASGGVPASALGQIALAGTGTLSVEAVSQALVDAGQWGTIDVTAVTRSLKPSKTPYLGTIDLQ